MERANEDEGYCRVERKETERSTRRELSVSLFPSRFHIYVSGSRMLRAECEDR